MSLIVNIQTLLLIVALSFVAGIVVSMYAMARFKR